MNSEWSSDEIQGWIRAAYREPDDPRKLDDPRFTRWNMEVAFQAGYSAAVGAGVGAAIEEALIGGNHLALLIGADHPAYTASHDEALAHYGAGDRFEIWCAWRSLMRLRDAAVGAEVGTDAIREQEMRNFLNDLARNK